MTEGQKIMRAVTWKCGMKLGSITQLCVGRLSRLALAAAPQRAPLADDLDA